MKKVILLIVLLLTVPSFSAMMQQSPMPGWLLVERCVGDFNYPSLLPGQWNFRGAIYTLDREGVHALRADVPVPYFLGLMSEVAFADHGAISPDGKYFVHSIGRSGTGNDVDRTYTEEYLIINETTPQSQGKGKRVEVPFRDASYGRFGLPFIQWVNNEIFTHGHQIYDVSGEPVTWNKDIGINTLLNVSPDGTRIFSRVGADRSESSYLLYDLENVQIIAEDLPFQMFQWLEDSSGGYFLSYDNPFILSFLNRDGELSEIYSGATNDIYSFTFSPDGQRFILVDNNRNLYMGDVSAEILYDLCTHVDHSSYIHLFGQLIVWAPDSQTFAFLVDHYPVLLNTDTLQTTVLQNRSSHLLGWYPLADEDRIPEPTPTPTATIFVSPTAIPTITPTPDMSACRLTTLIGVNLRGGPGRDFDALGSRAQGDTLSADGQARDGEGFTWWRLVDADLDTGLWVREDAVREEGGCINLPVIEPAS